VIDIGCILAAYDTKRMASKEDSAHSAPLSTVATLNSRTTFGIHPPTLHLLVLPAPTAAWHGKRRTPRY